MVEFMQGYLKSIRQWVSRHDGQFCDIALFPHKHKYSRIHWHGVIRTTYSGMVEMRKLWSLRVEHPQGTYAIKEFRKVKTDIGYAIGCLNQYRIEPVSVKGKNVLLISGRPFVFRQELIWAWWRGGRMPFPLW
jgi:hypothetical protein